MGLIEVVLVTVWAILFVRSREVLRLLDQASAGAHFILLVDLRRQGIVRLPDVDGYPLIVDALHGHDIALCSTFILS
jgi:hypothetical protein